MSDSEHECKITLAGSLEWKCIHASFWKGKISGFECVGIKAESTRNEIWSLKKWHTVNVVT